MLLDQPGGQVAAQFAGAGLALIEGHQVGLVVGVEHQIKGSGGMGQPAAAQVLARVGGGRWGVAHGGSSGSSRWQVGAPGDPTSSTPAQKRGCTPKKEVHPD